MGLDLSASAVRLVELAPRSGGGWSLEHLAAEPLGRGWLGDGQVVEFDEVAAAIGRVVARSRSRTREVAMALPASAVMMRRLTLPAGLGDDQLEPLVQLEVEQQIPFPLDELSLDFGVTGPMPDDPAQVEVFVAAARQETVQDRQALAEAAGLVARVLDIGSHASLRALRRCLAGPAPVPARALLALAELDASSLNLRVLRDDAVLYEHEHPREAAGRPEGTPDATGARQVAQALQQFFASAPHHAVDRLLLAGPPAASAGFVDQVAALTGFETRAVDVFEGMAVAADIDREVLQRETPACLVACGLAMRQDAA
jgi:type IV pilus assembly protein PilM